MTRHFRLSNDLLNASELKKLQCVLVRESCAIPPARAATLHSTGIPRCFAAKMSKRSVVVLMVEDDAALGPATVDLLVAGGHVATLASSFVEAFRMLLSPHRVEVLILDLQLGTHRGDELIETLRSVDAKLPAIVVLSARPMPELVRAAKTVGAEVYLQKPCSAQRILEAIELAVAKTDTNRESSSV
jgi:FixJ family two-component response regulator